MKGLIDSTLREGSQMVGASFSLDDKLAIVKRVDKIGVEELEIGVVTRYDRDLPELIRQCRAAKVQARLALWSRCRPEDIACASALKPDVLSLSIPGSDLHISKKLNKSRDWVLDRVSGSIKQARESGLGYISLGIEDATRADLAFLEEIIATAQKAGVDRIRLADTVGVATPLELAGQVTHLKEQFGIEIGVHCHNDFGMATANSLAALDGGADWADVTVYGIGERVGNARLEELAGFLAIRRGQNYDLAPLKELTREVALLCGRPLDDHHPVVGSRIFACETGLHLQGLRREPATYEPYPPETVGLKRQILFGSKTGRLEIEECLKGGKIKLANHEYDRIVGEIRKKTATLSYPLQLEGFSALVGKIIDLNAV
ncbi:MAG: pyruvate carboxyltransferase [Thermodesulfobacteriota bacterium]